MTTSQNIKAAATATRLDIARLIVAGLAGQRSSFADVDNWSGREFRAVMDAAEALLPLYHNDLLPDQMLARLGRSMTGSYGPLAG